jgi:hypothetical protein
MSFVRTFVVHWYYYIDNKMVEVSGGGSQCEYMLHGANIELQGSTNNA